MFRYWYFPLNIKFFDFVKAFYEKDTIDVRMFANYKYAVGDIVYIYSGEPYSQFLYITEVVRTDIPFEEADLQNDLRPEPMKSTVNNWMRLKIRQSVPPGTASLQGMLFAADGFKLGKWPKLIKDPVVLVYLNQEFEKFNCE